MVDPEGAPLLVSPRMAARLMGFQSSKAVYDLVRKGAIAPVVRTPRIRIPMTAIRAFIEARMDPPAPRPPAPRSPATPPMVTDVADFPAGPARRPQASPRRWRRTRESFRERMTRCQSCPRS